MLRDLTLKAEYSKPEDDIANAFYLPCMRRSTGYDRLTGYFSSLVFLVGWSALRTFLSAGGRMRIICSPSLSDADVHSLVEGRKAKQELSVHEVLVRDFERTLRQPELEKPAKLLATLVTLDFLEVKVATYRVCPSAYDRRLFHDKVGLFRDGRGDTVGFRGSMNETYLGLSSDGNVESIDVFPSWVGDRDSQRVQSAVNRFQALWNGAVEEVEVCHLPETFESYLRQFSYGHDWEAVLLGWEQELSSSGPNFPLPSQTNAESAPSKELPTLRPHQERVISDWLANDKRGIIAHATGSGKTVTALRAMELVAQLNCSIVVVAPSLLLVKMWTAEIRNRLHLDVLECTGESNAWTGGVLRCWLTGPSPRVAVATIHTASNPVFISEVNKSREYLLVVDEVHRAGASVFRSCLAVGATQRLGLSATPERYGDSDGTQVLLDYFNTILTPRYGLKEALRDGHLTPYQYHPTTVELTTVEEREWNRLTTAIRRRTQLLQKGTDGSPAAVDEQLKLLLVRRARIVKQASQKISKAIEILRRDYEPSSRWLVYCDSVAQLHEIRTNAGPGLPFLEYYSDMPGEDESTLRQFELHGGIMLSVRCLDEGVNIPSASHALIVASSQNPREFIQRRGRVLRLHPGKRTAVIHDLIVVPRRSGEADQILLAELARAKEFASSAQNPQCEVALNRICIQFGIDIAALAQVGEEEEFING